MIRPTVSRPVGQSVLVSSTHLGLTARFLLLSNSCGFVDVDALSDERTGLPFTVAAPRQRSHSWIRVPRDSWRYFTLSDSRLLQPGGPDPRIYIPQEQGVPVIPPGTGFPLCRVLRLTGLRWRYSNPPPRGVTLPSYSFFSFPSYNLFARTEWKTLFPPVPRFLHAYSLPRERVYRAVA
jgi:hypothetical protein